MRFIDKIAKADLTKESSLKGKARLFLKKLKRIKDNIGAYKGPHKYVSRTSRDRVINAPATRIKGKWPIGAKYPDSKLQTRISDLMVDEYIRAGIEEYGTKKSLTDLAIKASKNRKTLAKTLKGLGLASGVGAAGYGYKKYKDSK